MAEPAALPLTVVAHENRAGEMVGLRLLVASLARHAPDVPVVAYVPAALLADVDDSLQKLHPHSSTVPFDTDAGWGCKPTVMLHALDAQRDPAGRVLWIDTDILAVDGLERLAAVPAETLILAEESNPNDNRKIGDRQRALGLEPGDPRVTTLSSCVVGATAAHRPLLEAWEAGVATDIFRESQAKPWGERLLPGDQEVLEAVACSATFRDTPLHVLRNHNEMVQATYTPHPPPDGERPRQRPPLFVHATGDLKPWRTRGTRLAKEIFPYFDRAKPYLHRLEPHERDAFRSTSPPARWCKALLGTNRGYRTFATLRKLERRLRG